MIRPRLDHEKMLAAYRAGMSTPDLAERFGCKPNTIYSVLKRAGIEPDRGGHQRRSPTVYAQRAHKHEPAPEQYVQRDPCIWCGARGDYPCGHGR